MNVYLAANSDVVAVGFLTLFCVVGYQQGFKVHILCVHKTVRKLECCEV